MNNRLLSLLPLLLAALCLGAATAFTPVLVTPVRPTPQVGAASPTALHVFGNKKKSATRNAEEAEFWQGEWVCKDCGYIYNRVRI
jgi:hypothetical protein